MHLFLPYQQRWVNDKSRVKVCEKSRRIGLTWAEACDCALDSAEGKDDCWYIGYNEDQALEFIRDVEWWCRKFKIIAPKTKEVYFNEDGEEITTPLYLLNESGIKGFRIEFYSGCRVTALSSRPRNLRGKGGRVVIDEAAFHDDLQELLKAAFALLMWGGRVSIISTHNGIENDFNKLVEDCRSGKLNYSLHKITLDDALSEGLYQRICLMTKEEWSLEKQELWRQELIDIYGVGAAEELFCEPLSLTEGIFFNRAWFPIIEELPYEGYLGIQVRYWDLASTEKKRKNKSNSKDKKKTNDPDYTASVRMVEWLDDVIIVDATMDMEDPGGVDALLTATAEHDGKEVIIGAEEEGGSSGKLFAHHLETHTFKEHIFESIKSTGSKIVRAKPLSTAAKLGKVHLLRGPWNKDFLTILHKFPQGRYDDPIDAASGAFNMIKGDSMATWLKAMQMQ